MVLNRALLILLLLILVEVAHAQVNRYMVFFTDKEASSYSTNNPEEFLSVRSIARRTAQGIAVTEQDIPVNESYISGVAGTGAEVFFKTRWMNGVLVQCDLSLKDDIEALPYVDRVERVAPGQRLIPNGKKKLKQKVNGTAAVEPTDDQLNMLGIPDLHQQGYKGAGIFVAVFDAGFPGVNSAAAFQHLFDNGKILLTQDFVFNTENVYQYDEHGTEVLSVIAGNLPGTFTGGAPEATFQLFVTEDVATEYRIEEYNWLFAAERADSAGVDVINSSLGYYDFDDASVNYLKADMDGETTVVSKAAQFAADRGIVVVCSAGNEGNNSWQIITAPADAEDVLAIASVNKFQVRVASSSIGPAADGRIKPDVAAMGGSTSVILPSGNVGSASGTSLAAPLITSLVTVLWQANPSLTNKQLMDAIRLSASQASAPDNLLGYGIPHTQAVANYLSAEEQADVFVLYPNPVTDIIWLRPQDPNVVSSCRLELISNLGQIVYKGNVNFSWRELTHAIDVTNLRAGLYTFRVKWNDKVFQYRFVKNNN